MSATPVPRADWLLSACILQHQPILTNVKDFWLGRDRCLRSGFQALHEQAANQENPLASQCHKCHTALKKYYSDEKKIHHKREEHDVICWLDECSEKLSVPSGTLAFEDPGMGPGVEVHVGQSQGANITYLLGEQDIVALELKLQPQQSCENYKRLGCVGVDSAQIVIGDRWVMENCPDKAIFLSTNKENEPGIEKIVQRFGLKTRRIIDETTEVIADDYTALFHEISSFITSDLHETPSKYVHFHEENGFWVRCCEAGWDGGFLGMGDSSVFVLNTGGDGSFDVIGGFSGETLTKIWVLLESGLFTDGRVQYSPAPLATRPPRKPPSPEFIAMMEDALNSTQKKPWWKVW